MKLYIRMVRPMLSYPGQRYEPKYKNIESELVWYPEEDMPRIREKYKHLENTFEHVVFEERYTLFCDTQTDRFLQWTDMPTVP